MDPSVLPKPKIPVLNPIIEPTFLNNTGIFPETDQSVLKPEVPEPLDKQIREISSNKLERTELPIPNEDHCNNTALSKPRIVQQPPPPLAPGGDSPINHSVNCCPYVSS
jgi:hypothetical protein